MTAKPIGHSEKQPDIYDTLKCILSENKLSPLATTDWRNNQCASERQTHWNKSKWGQAALKGFGLKIYPIKLPHTERW